MRPEELTERCGVPAATAEALYTNFLEALSAMNKSRLLILLVVAIAGLGLTIGFVSYRAVAVTANNQLWQPLSEIVTPEKLSEIVAENTARVQSERNRPISTRLRTERPTPGRFQHAYSMRRWRLRISGLPNIYRRESSNCLCRTNRC